MDLLQWTITFFKSVLNHKYRCLPHLELLSFKCTLLNIFWFLLNFEGVDQFCAKSQILNLISNTLPSDLICYRQLFIKDYFHLVHKQNNVDHVSVLLLIKDEALIFEFRCDSTFYSSTTINTRHTFNLVFIHDCRLVFVRLFRMFRSWNFFIWDLGVVPWLFWLTWGFWVTP